MSTVVEPFDKVLCQWLTSSAPTLSHAAKRRVLSRELRIMQTEKSILGGGSTNDDLQARAAALSASLETISSQMDPGSLRAMAERITVCADRTVLSASLDPGCTLELSHDGTRCYLRGVDAVAQELCQENESAAPALQAKKDEVNNDDDEEEDDAATVARGVSPVKSWCARDGAVGTHVTYFLDAEKTQPLFSFHTIFSINAEGTLVEGIQRVLEIHDTCNGKDIGEHLHFGTTDQ